jgi:hypothetical protein
MILALISNKQQGKQVSLEDIDFDAVPPPVLQGFSAPSYVTCAFNVYICNNYQDTHAVYVNRHCVYTIKSEVLLDVSACRMPASMPAAMPSSMPVQAAAEAVISPGNKRGRVTF